MTVIEKTIYERVYFVYSRDNNGFLTCRRQKGAIRTEEQAWQDFQDAIIDEDDAYASLVDLTLKTSGTMKFFERTSGDVVVGFATELFVPNIFDLWFLRAMIDNGVVAFDLHKSVDGTLEAVAFTEIFESTIKNTARIDRWMEGRDQFIENVRFFTSRRLKIEAVLPAFPCKSHNLEKVKSPEPDMGEELAVRRIIDFVEKINSIYEPGMIFHIVSDGHVFSDCINVDDDTVDAYTIKLMETYERVKPKGFDGVRFRGLNDCFRSHLKKAIGPMLQGISIEHHLDTKIDEETNVNRKILMLGCDDNDDVLREQIKTPGHPRLYLYRGFNKFMYEDLINTPKAKRLLGKKFKKLVSLVSYEMIRRNDAYSNLVELVFPFHLRFLIHAHHNAGPKYGVRLLDPAICKTGLHNQDEEDRLLHIPTPWHNAVFRVEGESKLVVAPSRLAAQYDEDETYNGGWDEESRCFVYKTA